MSRTFHAAVAALLFAGTLTPSQAAAPEPAPAPNPTTTIVQKSDPNQVICEKQTVVGSRLAVKRVCKTRAQWADDRLQDRQEIEKIQVQRGSPAE